LQLGFIVEGGKLAAQKIRRPVFFVCRSRSITESCIQAKARILQTGISPGALVPRGAIPVLPHHAIKRRIDRAPHGEIG